MDVIFREDNMHFSMFSLEDVVKVYDQNICDMDHSYQNLDLVGDTLHNDIINVEVDVLEPSSQNMDLSS